MTLLDDLALKYGSDKTPTIKHHYTQWYYPYFENKRNDIKKLLEIGIGDAIEMAWTGVPNYQTGASLRMWRDFFPNATVYGADIKDLTVEGIKTFQCDQSNVEGLKAIIAEIGGDLDVVIDDGSHRADHQVITCLTLMPLLQHSVTYVIEDVGHPEIKSQLEAYNVEEIRFRPRTNRDDRLLIVKHRD